MNKKSSDIKCNYCGEQAKLVSGKVIYPHRLDLFELKFWQCDPCSAYVGCHKLNFGKKIYRNDIPFGTLATKELRGLRSKTHKVFDPYWKEDSSTRSECYDALAVKMGIKIENCHISHFDEEQCKTAILICKDLLHSNKEEK